SLTEVYTEQLVLRGDLTAAESEAIDQKFEAKLQTALEEVRAEPQPPLVRAFTGRWKGLSPRYAHAPVATGVPFETLRQIADGLTRVPEHFNVHPKIARLLITRREELAPGKAVDWAFAESLAFGSLLLEGVPVRLSGQDSRRG